MAKLETAIPASLKAALDAEVARTKRTVSSIVTAALSRYLNTQIHTLFQVSTSGALSQAWVPFAVVDPETDVSISQVSSFKDLQARCDGFRQSGNIFYAIRLDDPSSACGPGP